MEYLIKGADGTAVASGRLGRKTASALFSIYARRKRISMMDFETIKGGAKFSLGKGMGGSRFLQMELLAGKDFFGAKDKADRLKLAVLEGALRGRFPAEKCSDFALLPEHKGEKIERINYRAIDRVLMKSDDRTGEDARHTVNVTFKKFLPAIGIGMLLAEIIPPYLALLMTTAFPAQAFKDAWLARMAAARKNSIRTISESNQL